ncbi:MAG: hypothetical protein ACM3X7_00470 [Solirubrobacterales bacterium]
MKIQYINNLFDNLNQDEKSDIEMLPLTKGIVFLAPPSHLGEDRIFINQEV